MSQKGAHLAGGLGVLAQVGDFEAERDTLEDERENEGPDLERALRQKV